MLFTQTRQNKMNNRTFVRCIFMLLLYINLSEFDFFPRHFHRVHLIPMNQNSRLARAIEINKKKVKKTQPKTVSNNNQLIIVLRFFPSIAIISIKYIFRYLFYFFGVVVVCLRVLLSLL